MGQIYTQLNVRPKGGLTSDTMVNPKNNAHILAIVTRSGRNLGENVVEVDQSSKEKSCDHQARFKKIG